jgi:hypothetical protein
MTTATEETSGDTAVAEPEQERIEPTKLKQQVIELLEAAERASEDVIAAARADAEALRSAAHSDVDRLTTEAKTEAEHLSLEASSEAEKRVDGARATADELIAKARAEVEALRGAATTEADDVRRRAKQTAVTTTERIGSLNDELMTQAATAEREVANLRRLLESAPKRLEVEEEAPAPATEVVTQAADEPVEDTEQNGSRKNGFFANLLSPRHEADVASQKANSDEHTTLAAQMLVAGGAPEKVRTRLEELGVDDPDGVLAAAGHTS